MAKTNWIKTDIFKGISYFAGISYLDDIIEPEQWNDFVKYVNKVFNVNLRHISPTAVFSVTEMLEWADSFRGI